MVDYIPRPVETMDRRGRESRDDRGEGRKIVQRTAFLCSLERPEDSQKQSTYIGHRNEVLDDHNPSLDV